MSQPDRLERLAAGELDPDLVRWLADGAKRVLEGDEPSLDQALGLVGPRGQPSVAVALRRDRRDFWIRIAIGLLDGNFDAFTEQYREFLAGGLWAQWSALAGPPAGASKLRSAFWHIASTRMSAPESGRQLRRIVES